MEIHLFFSATFVTWIIFCIWHYNKAFANSPSLPLHSFTTEQVSSFSSGAIAFHVLIMLSIYISSEVRSEVLDHYNFKEFVYHECDYINRVKCDECSTIRNYTCGNDSCNGKTYKKIIVREEEI